MCRCAGHEEASEGIRQPHAHTYSAQLELNGQNYVLGIIRSRLVTTYGEREIERESIGAGGIKTNKMLVKKTMAKYLVLGILPLKSKV